MRIIAELLQSERGQDLIEYTLLLAFILLASAALAINSGGSISGIWTVTNSNLNAAASQAASGS